MIGAVRRKQQRDRLAWERSSLSAERLTTQGAPSERADHPLRGLIGDVRPLPARLKRLDERAGLGGGACAVNPLKDDKETPFVLVFERCGRVL